MFFRKAIGYGISNPIEAAKSFNEFRNNIENIAKNVFKENNEGDFGGDDVDLNRYGVTDTGNELIIKDVFNHSGIEIRARQVGYGSYNKIKYDATLYDNGKEILTITDIEGGIYPEETSSHELAAASDIVFWFSVSPEDSDYTDEQIAFIENNSESIALWSDELKKASLMQDNHNDLNRYDYGESSVEKDAKRIASVYDKIYKESVSSMKIKIEGKYSKASKTILEGFAPDLKPKKLRPIEERAMNFFKEGFDNPYEDDNEIEDTRVFKMTVRETISRPQPEGIEFDPDKHSTFTTDHFEFNGIEELIDYLKNENAQQWSSYPMEEGDYLMSVGETIDYHTGHRSSYEFFIKVVDTDGRERDLNYEEMQEISKALRI